MTDANRRVGEATNPGPACTFRVGLRGKEATLLENGVGIITVAETQLSHVTQPAARSALQACGRRLNRQIRVYYGAPAPLRPNSTWAGAWTGTAQVSDYPSRKIVLPWPSGVWETGRVLIAQHSIQAVAVTVASVHGFAPGPLTLTHCPGQRPCSKL